MGGNRHGERQHRRGGALNRPRSLLVLAALLVGSACDDGTTAPQGTSPTGEPVVTEIGPGDALTALVQWYVAETEPVVDDAGDPVLPVIYMASESGETVAVGVQATVAERSADDAVVRFADDRSEAIDDDLDGSPVKDDGVLMLLGEIPEAAPSVTFPVTLYRSADDEQTLEVDVTATGTGVEITATPATPS